MDYFALAFSDEEVGRISNLGLAHLGDAVYELVVRAWLCKKGKCTSQGLHREAVAYVNARKQAELAEKILPLLSEEEAAVYRRGRNAKVNTIPKAADIGQYHSATGLEALFGWLYLHGRTDRINELFELMLV